MIHLGIHWVPVYQYVLDQLAPKKIMYHKEVGAGERVCESERERGRECGREGERIKLLWQNYCWDHVLKNSSVHLFPRPK